MGHVNPNVINDAYRFYADDVAGSITAQTALAAVDTDISIEGGVKFHWAMLATETAGGNANNEAFSVEYRKNGGTWTDLTTTTTDPIYAVTADNCTTADNASYGTTALTTGATIQGTEYCNNADAAGNVSLSSSSFEKTTCVIINTTGNSNGDTFEFRLTNNGTPLDADTTIGTVTAQFPDTLLADDTESASNTESVGLTTSYDFLADDVQSTSETSQPNLVDVPNSVDLFANDVQSTSETQQGTITAVISNLLADDAQSTSETQTVAIGQEHTLLADDTQSASETSQPTLLVVTLILADDVESASETQAVDLSEENTLLANDVQSTSSVTQANLNEAAEYLRPDGDSTVGSWTDEGGAAVNLWQSIDEGFPPNDSDYIRSEPNPATSTCKIQLSNPSFTPNSGTHTVVYRYGKLNPNTQQLDLVVRLVEGASTVIASWTHNNITDTLVTAEQALTGPQIASITNYNNLFLEFEANAP